MRKGKPLSIHVPALAILSFALITATLFYLCTRLFFYDEDIFVVNANGNFLTDLTRAAAVKLTFLADNLFYNTHAAGYHVTSMLLHIVNSILSAYTFKTLLELITPEKQRITNASGIFLFLFLLSPVHSEPLCYLLGRAGLLVTLFCMLSLLFFLKALFKRPGLLLLSLFFFLLALFSYEISWTLPLIILATGYYLKYRLHLKSRQVAGYIIPYFIVFAIWFLIKVVLIDRFNITPYGNNVVLSVDALRLLKNGVALFFRNIIPPFKSTITLTGISVMAALLFAVSLFYLKNKHGHIFYFSLLILGACILGYAPAVTFGINSHNSESERYIYFSSVFAIMFIALAFSFISNQRTRAIVFTITCCMYAGVLFTTITYYIRGGRFSESYLQVLVNQYNKDNKKNIYLINQPSQYKGALLFRAYSNERGSSVDRLYTIDDYMHSLGNIQSPDYITLSKAEVLKSDAVATVILKPLDSISSVFPEFRFSRSYQVLRNAMTGDSIFFDKQNSSIVGLKAPAVYIFK